MVRLQINRGNKDLRSFVIPTQGTVIHNLIPWGLQRSPYHWKFFVEPKQCQLYHLSTCQKKECHSKLQISGIWQVALVISDIWDNKPSWAFSAVSKTVPVSMHNHCNVDPLVTARTLPSGEMLMWSYWQTEPFESCSGIGKTLKVFGSSSRWYLTEKVRNISRKQQKGSKALCSIKNYKMAYLQQ